MCAGGALAASDRCRGDGNCDGYPRARNRDYDRHADGYAYQYSHRTARRANGNTGTNPNGRSLRCLRAALVREVVVFSRDERGECNGNA